MILGIREGCGGVVPLIHRYAAAMTAKLRRKRMKRNVSQLFAVTRFTP